MFINHSKFKSLLPIRNSNSYFQYEILNSEKKNSFRRIGAENSHNYGSSFYEKVFFLYFANIFFSLIFNTKLSLNLNHSNSQMHTCAAPVPLRTDIDTFNYSYHRRDLRIKQAPFFQTSIALTGRYKMFLK